MASREVEDALAAHPGVAAVAVVGVPDDTGARRSRPSSSPARERADRRGRRRLGREAIGGFKKPRHVLVVDDLPRNATGKVVKAEVRAIAARALADRA